MNTINSPVNGGTAAVSSPANSGTAAVIPPFDRTSEAVKRSLAHILEHAPVLNLTHQEALSTLRLIRLHAYLADRQYQDVYVHNDDERLSQCDDTDRFLALLLECDQRNLLLGTRRCRLRFGGLHFKPIFAALRLLHGRFCGGRRLRICSALHCGEMVGRCQAVPAEQAAACHKEAQTHNQNQTGSQCGRTPPAGMLRLWQRTDALLLLQCQQTSVEVRRDGLPIHIFLIGRLHASTTISAFSLPLARLSRLRTVPSRVCISFAISPVE